MIRIAIVYPASAALPNVERIRTSPSQLAVPTITCRIALPERRSIRSITAGSRRRCRGAMTMRLCPRKSVTNCTMTAIPRPHVVETAAPVTPSAGKGPSPKIRHGSRRRLMTFASQSTRIAIAASPAPRKIALIEEEQQDHDVHAEHHAREARARPR